MENQISQVHFKKNQGRLIQFSSKIILRSASLYVGFALLTVLSIIILAVSKLALDAMGDLNADSTQSFIQQSSVFSMIMMFYWIIYGAIFIMFISAISIILYKNEYAQDTFSLTVGSELSRTSIYFEKMAALAIFSIAIGFISNTIPFLLFSAICSQYASLTMHMVGYMLLTIIIVYFCVSTLIILFSYICNSIGLWFIVSIMMVSGIVPIITGTVFFTKHSMDSFGISNAEGVIESAYSDEYTRKQNGTELPGKFDPNKYNLEYYLMENGIEPSKLDNSVQFGPDYMVPRYFMPYLTVNNFQNWNFADLFTKNVSDATTHGKSEISLKTDNTVLNSFVNTISNDYIKFDLKKDFRSVDRQFIPKFENDFTNAFYSQNPKDPAKKLMYLFNGQKFTLNYTFNTFLNQALPNNANVGLMNTFGDFAGTKGIDFQIQDTSHADGKSTEAALADLKGKNDSIYNILNKYYEVNPNMKSRPISDLLYISDSDITELLTSSDDGMNSQMIPKLISNLIYQMIGNKTAALSKTFKDSDFSEYGDFAHYLMYNANKIENNDSQRSYLYGAINDCLKNISPNDQMGFDVNTAFRNMRITGPLVNLLNYLKIVRDHMLEYRASASTLGIDTSDPKSYNNVTSSLDSYGRDIKLISFISVWNQFDMMINPVPTAAVGNIFSIANFDISSKSLHQVENSEIDMAKLNPYEALLIKQKNQWSPHNETSYDIAQYKLVVQYYGLYITYIAIGCLMTLASWAIFNRKDLN